MHTKMEVHAAIERIIKSEHFDLDAARIVIEFGLNIPLSSHKSLEIAMHKENDSSLQGYVSGIGNIKYDESREEEVIEKTFGIREGRVGGYKIRRFRDSIISFNHFWKSSVVTASVITDRPTIYNLGFNRKTFEPLFLAINHYPLTFPIFIVPTKRCMLIVRLSLVLYKYIQGKKKGKYSHKGFWFDISP